MLQITLNNPDWVLIRQILALSLITGRSVKIYNAISYVMENCEYSPILNDLERVIRDINAGELLLGKNSLIYHPVNPGSGTFIIDTGKFSSIVEVVLFLLPCLLKQNFRSSLIMEGVTHGALSYPTAFINQTLFSLVERLGFYASMSLKRFGFYGSGGGRVEVKAYPFEIKENMAYPEIKRTEISGAKIFFSGMNINTAKREKEFIISELNIPENSVSIINVMDSDGMGNSVMVYVNFFNGNGLHPANFIFSKDADIYNFHADFVFSEDKMFNLMKGLFIEVNDFMNNKYIPVNVMREVYIFYLIGNYKFSLKKNMDFLNTITDIYNQFID